MANFRYKDIDISLQKNPLTGDIYSITDNDAVKRSVRLLVLTSLGEKLFHPEIGSAVYSSLFENLDASTNALCIVLNGRASELPWFSILSVESRSLGLT